MQDLPNKPRCPLPLEMANVSIFGLCAAEYTHLALLGDLGGHCSLTENQFRGYIKSNMFVSEPIDFVFDAFLEKLALHDDQQPVRNWLDDQR
jgi:hypothetical protein